MKTAWGHRGWLVLVGEMKASAFYHLETFGSCFHDDPPTQEVQSKEVCVGVKAGKRNASAGCQ